VSTLNSLNSLDIVLILIISISMLMSIRKGFSRELISVTSSIVALLLGMWFYDKAGVLVQPYVDSAPAANLLGFVLIVVVVLMLGSLIAWIVGRFLITVGLSFFDRLLGAAFGLLRGGMIAVALLTAFMAFGPHAGTDSAPPAVVHSKIAPYVLEASRVAVAVAPADLKQSFRKYYTKVKETLEKTTGMGRKEDS
jgi:membrane protein required for colicin V production